MDLTSWINSHGKAQYTQVGELIREHLDDEEKADKLTNAVSVWVLEQALGYMDYLKAEAKL